MLDKNLLTTIKAQSIKYPYASAVCDDNHHSTYFNLEASSNRLARYLKSQKVKQGDIVALHMKRSFDLLVAMLAVWKTGAAYVCLDFASPPARLSEIVRESQPKCIVSDPSLLNSLPSEFRVLTCCDPELFDCSSESISQSNNTENQPAYLIYTSGSTGKSKGVLIAHNNLSNYIFWFNEHFQITKDDVFSFNSSPAFDFAITCIHVPLAAGAQILITNEPDVLDIEAYFNELVKHRVTFAKWTPSYFKVLVSYVEKNKPDLSSLRYLMIAGEELLTSYVERWFAVYPSHTIINEYGPTETTVGITTQVVTKSSLNRQLKTVPIGYPVGNTRLCVVDKNHHLLSQGEVGELWIAGASVGCGYYKSPEITQSRFIKSPFSEADGVLYKTGDLVKQLSDGSYLYIGRIDHQIKINGFRVDPSEVENCLLQQHEINSACVVVRELKSKARHLEAYLVLKPSDHCFDSSILRDKISQYLPEFMLPKYYHQVDRIPLTPNGKTDHHALISQLGCLEAG